MFFSDYKRSFDIFCQFACSIPDSALSEVFNFIREVKTGEAAETFVKIIQIHGPNMRVVLFGTIRFENKKISAKRFT